MAESAAKENPMSQQVLPFYLVCDESSSMSGEPVEAINRSLPWLHREIGGDPRVSGRARFCLVSFSHEAHVLLPLADLSAVTSIPALTPGGGTSYRVVLDLLRETIDKDVAALRHDGHQVLRPAVFFLTDGRPNDAGEWPAAHRRVTDPSWDPRPDILTFGLGLADAPTIRRVATDRGFIADGTLGPGRALREFARSLIRSMAGSAASTADGGMSPELPGEVPGFTAIPADVT